MCSDSAIWDSFRPWSRAKDHSCNISPARAATMVTPSSLPLGRCTTFRNSGESPSVIQRSTCSMGQTADSTFSPCFSLAWDSVRPTWATSGSVNIAQGTLSNTDFLIERQECVSDSHEPLIPRVVCELVVAGSVNVFLHPLHRRVNPKIYPVLLVSRSATTSEASGSSCSMMRSAPSTKVHRRTQCAESLGHLAANGSAADHSQSQR
jgi:hypothetical protein